MNWVRRVAVFLLGLLLIYDSLVNTFHIIEFVAGCIMIGVFPIDYIIDVVMRPAKDEEQIDRLRQIMDEKRKDE